MPIANANAHANKGYQHHANEYVNGNVNENVN